MDAKELKPCPFCGSSNISAGEVLTVDRQVGTATQSMCRECGSLGPEAHLQDGEVDYGDVKATAAWNRRAALASDAVQAPEGWKLVPATATDEMLIALLSSGEADALAGCKDGYTASRLLQASGVVERYSAMLNAAPVAPAAAAPQLVVNPDDLDFTPDEQHSISDMANIGRALLECLASMCPGYSWNESPTEIVSDLINERDDARADYDRIRHGLAKWAAGRWNAEVANRPLVNVHRRALDDAWRQVIRHCGADDVALLGPTHSDLLAAAPASPTPLAAAGLTGNTWKTGMPPVPDGKCREFIIAVRRAQSKPPGKVFVFSANYANNFTDDGCLEGRDGDEFVANGWYQIGVDMSGEYNDVFQPIELGDGDAIEGWQELPKWDAALLSTTHGDKQ